MTWITSSTRGWRGNLHQPSRDTAFMQWKGLYQALRQIADVRLLHAQKGAPDMVFVAHAALVQHGVAAASSFAHPQRQTEERHVRKWLEVAGFLLWLRRGRLLLRGKGMRCSMRMGRIYGRLMGSGPAGSAISMWRMPGIRE